MQAERGIAQVGICENINNQNGGHHTVRYDKF